MENDRKFNDHVKDIVQAKEELSTRGDFEIYKVMICIYEEILKALQNIYKPELNFRTDVKWQGVFTAFQNHLKPKFDQFLENNTSRLGEINIASEFIPYLELNNIADIDLRTKIFECLKKITA